MAYTYSGAVTSEITSICDLIGRITEALADDLNHEDLMELKLIMSELMINGCEHGNGNDRHKKVGLELRVTDERIDLIVSDEGEGIRYDRECCDPTALCCGGRGLRIVEALCDSFSIDKSQVCCTLYR